ncbi:MAG: hypothetical protein IJB97_00705 [Clostridia bacterium]|nr:hypothetical protein [Clostridia bacterium]
MKLEKREITLNEKDTLTDMLLMERALLSAYAQACGEAERKESRLLMTENFTETAKDAFSLRDLLDGVEENG